MGGVAINNATRMPRAAAPDIRAITKLPFQTGQPRFFAACLFQLDALGCRRPASELPQLCLLSPHSSSPFLTMRADLRHFERRCGAILHHSCGENDATRGLLWA